MSNPRNDFHYRPDWQNRDVVSINREDAHTRWGAWENEKQAVEYRYGSSGNMMSLAGTWSFRLCRNPSGVDDFYRKDYDASGFSPITVPGNWEVQGFDKPIYTNVIYPWNLESGAGSEGKGSPHEADKPYSIAPSEGKERVPNPPYVPEDYNPTGCYRRSFTVPSGWKGKEIYIRFEGVETVYYLWVNGRPVGYSQDSKLPSEFNISSFLEEGENILALEVIRFADSTYLEDQDYWYLSGIYRNVFLIAKPALHIADWKITALPESCGNGEISADVTVSREPGFAGCRIRLALYDGTSKLAEGEGSVAAMAQYRNDTVPTANTGRAGFTVKNIQEWSPAKPKLYTAVISLVDKNGKILDIESSRIGFKRIEVKHGVVYLNGTRLLVQGVNRHDHSWRNGRAVPVEHMREEIKQMKLMNINAVRTCHYPDTPDWYELCDETGILLVCETDLETHGVMGQLSHDPAWAAAYLERAVRMVQNYKNHVSIFSWSLGNESGVGANHAAMYGFIKEYDKTRLCQYEAGEPGKNISDVRGNMYAPVEKILKMLADPEDDRPIILVEYLYQICNAGGGLEHFLTLSAEYPRFQGGFVWDWQDKCLVGKTKEGREFFAYGGDFDEPFVENSIPPFKPFSAPPFMTSNGVVLPDLRWKPVAFELKQAYCPLRIGRPERFSWEAEAPADLFVLKRVNCLAGDEKGEDLECVQRIRENGDVISEKILNLPPLKVWQEARFRADLSFERKAGAEYTVEFSLRLTRDLFYAPKGREAGCFQFSAGRSPVEAVPVSYSSNAVGSAGSDSITVEESAEAAAFVVYGGGLRSSISKETGLITALEKEGKAYLVSGAKPVLNRPLTGLDVRQGWGWYDDYEKVRAMKHRVTGFRLLKGSSQCRIEFDFSGRTEAAFPVEGLLAYIFDGQGGITVDYHIKLDEGFNALPRVGLELILPPGFEDIEYYGRGPVENYSDRKLAAVLGHYSSTVGNEHFPFVPPSECGGHEETRWLCLKGKKGEVLRISGDRPFHFDVHHSSVEDYIAAGHDHEIPRREESFLHIDAAHGPIGSNMAWSSVMPGAYALSGGVYDLRFRLELL
ncbi:MAG: hypothetical protein LBC57_01400 [Treponema sp.]|jgi:beta-galactosidase|nr:hypothetical protein [Treponema sp.]